MTDDNAGFGRRGGRGAIIAPMSIRMADGTELSAGSDLQLAWVWAEHEAGEKWATMSRAEQNESVADALRALRDAYDSSDDDAYDSSDDDA